ncbi:dTDP-glucose 4,6-dehydratase, partial [Candidatus Saccharibacteria bacterium]|nr:dTDP-glucose 4,6-dehydratase [Candidatus Saccharibacteria bacterium]NIV03556.1 dTDP-glucose 4,6-dehydratase [Calditrichia bacterium]NIS38105.1 dTDP-glucose 4,6-dehydratase [Candidatus Saccharibacteria bacterium]NIV71822.1 dTDP-glucose 4,6-dehydratase [Calditrichia bacterium]NIV98534.1 dTDP-glucose 4,6-dehydratase [Candidatus Saccharibacteria bacterium]
EKYPDYKIVNLDKLTYAGNLENLKPVEDHGNYEFVKGDICDEKLVDELVKDCDAIIHLAAESHVDRSIMDASEFVRTNVIGTHVLLDAALKNGKKRFHHVSTDEVFGALGPDDEPFHEYTPYDPRSPYSSSKAASDHLVRSYFHTHGLPITISNCSNNYGPYQFPEKLIPLFIANLVDGKKVPVYGDGQQIRDWIHVKDHNKGVDIVLHKGREGETYCLGGENERANLEITHKLLELLDKDHSHIEHVVDRPGHDRRYAINISKMRKEFGWGPELDFDTGMKETVDWYLANEPWWRNVMSGDYQKYYKDQYITRK